MPFKCEPARFPPANPRRQIGAVDPGAQLVQRLGVPPAVHVGFTRRQVAAREQPCIEALVADLEIPRSAPADLYARQGENLGHLPGRGRRTARSNEGCGGSGFWRARQWLLRRGTVQTGSRGTHFSLLRQFWGTEPIPGTSAPAALDTRPRTLIPIFRLHCIVRAACRHVVPPVPRTSVALIILRRQYDYKAGDGLVGHLRHHFGGLLARCLALTRLLDPGL